MVHLVLKANGRCTKGYKALQAAQKPEAKSIAKRSSRRRREVNVVGVPEGLADGHRLLSVWVTFPAWYCLAEDQQTV